MSTGLPGQTQVQVVSMLDLPSADPARIGKMDVLVTYRPDPAHSFTIKLPQEGLTPEKLDAAVRSDWAIRKQYLNRSINV